MGCLLYREKASKVEDKQTIPLSASSRLQAHTTFTHLHMFAKVVIEAEIAPTLRVRTLEWLLQKDAQKGTSIDDERRHLLEFLLWSSQTTSSVKRNPLNYKVTEGRAGDIVHTLKSCFVERLHTFLIKGEKCTIERLCWKRYLKKTQYSWPTNTDSWHWNSVHMQNFQKAL